MSQVILFTSLTLDGVMQAPGRPDEDRRGGFAHGGWGTAYSDAVLGKIAVPGDTFRGGRAKWTVEKVKGRRILTIRLTADQPWPKEALEHSGIHPQSSSESDGAQEEPPREQREPREKETGHIS